MNMMRDFDSKDGIMMIGGMSTVDIAREFGTPVYVCDEARIRENYRNIYGAFSRYMDTKIHYACKANTNLAILRILARDRRKGCRTFGTDRQDYHHRWRRRRHERCKPGCRKCACGYG